jgi:DNA-binding protein H-NS
MLLKSDTGAISRERRSMTRERRSMTRQEELDAIRRFEESKGVTKLPMIDAVDALFERERKAREERSEKRMRREPQRLHAWTNGRGRKPKKTEDAR